MKLFFIVFFLPFYLSLYPTYHEDPPCVTFLSENKDELKEFEQKIKKDLPDLWYCNFVHISQKS
jgi:hypothetical protein